MRQHNLRVTGSLSINGENVISASELSALSSSIVSRIEGLNPSQIGTGSYTASILSTGGFTINTDTKITGSLLVSNLSGSGVNYISAVSGGLLVAVSGSNAILNTERFVATEGQTVFNSSYGYLTGLVQIYYNGTKLDSTEFSDTNGSTITLTTGSNQTGDVVEVVTYRPVSGVEQNALRTKTTYTASASQTTFAVDYTPGLIDVYFNGSHLASEEYTANNGTTIVLTEAAVGGEVLDIFVYNNQIGAFSGIGGGGEAGQFAYFSSQSGISGSSVISISGSNIIAGGSIIPSVSGSYDLGSSTKPFRHIYVGTGSIYLVDNQGQVTNTISAQTIVTTDTLNSSSIDLTKSLPVGTVSSSAQIVGILSALNNFTASNSTTNTFTASTAARLSDLENKTGSLASTGSNTFIGTQVFTGSVYITSDLIVQGSSSLQNITASAVSIGTNKVILNTDNPAVRYAGISVIDSGSTGLTGSILWDSTNNNWLYQNPSGSSYTSAKFISGPQSQTLGSELGLVTNYLVKAIADDHISSSAIFDNGTTIGLKSNTEVTGSFSILGDGAFINRTTSGEPYIFFRKDGVNRGSIYGVPGGGLRIFDNNDAEILTITGSNVGINTTNPLYKLHVLGSSQVTSYFQTSGTYAPIIWTGDNGTTRGGVIAHDGNISIGGLNASGTGINANQSLTIKSGSGFVGINTNATNVPLTISTSGNTTDGTFYSTLTINNTGTSTYSRFRLDRSGVAKWGLTLLNDDRFAISNLYENGAASANDSTFVIKNNNNIGIGTTNPQFKLHIANTTGDDATWAGGILIENTGTPAGEPVIAFKNIATSGNYMYAGLNQSSNFSIAYGSSFTDGNTKFQITSAGQILTWSNPAFMAYGNGNATINYNGTYLIYPSVHVNRGGHYNASTGVFTAPVTGIYMFSWSHLGGNDQDVYRFFLRINDVTFLGDYHLRIDTGATGGEYGTNGNRNAIVNLSANDTVRIWFRNDGTTMYGVNATTDSYHNFMGYLIG